MVAFNIGHQIGVSININYKYSLVGILSFIGMLDIIQQPALLQIKQNLLKRNLSLLDKLLVFVFAPSERFHDGDDS